jgi:hypothetical protein
MPPGGPVTYGTAQTSYATVYEWEFSPIESSQTYSDIALGSLNARRYPIAGAGFFAGVHLPSGAVLQSIEFDFCDSNASGQHIAGVVHSCANVDGLCTALAGPIISVSNAVTPCLAYVTDVSGLNYVVDNTQAKILLQLLGGAGDNTTSVAGAVVGYRLSVSPPPATATFNDVPTSDPGFQFVEALAKSGITAGCGGGNYCPDATLTRRQMAVFLAKALGLQFP